MNVIPFDIYQKKLSYSRIKDLLISVKTYIDGVVNPTEQTEAMKLGSLFELLLLQPAEFDNKYFIQPIAPKFTSVADQKKAQIKEPVSIDDQKEVFASIIKNAAGNRIIIHGEMYLKAIRMVNAFMLHPLASDLVSQENEYQKKFELSVDGIDIVGYLDILCRAKEDISIPGMPILKKGHLYIVDIKKTNNVEDSNLNKQFREYKYYIQYYLYKKAIELYIKQGLIEKAPDQFEIPVFYIFQEDNCPYDTHVINIDQMYEEQAKAEIRRAIIIFKTLRDNPEKLFFGINPGITTLNLKNWQKQDFEEKEKKPIFYESNNETTFHSFMVEKELDTSICRPSISITIENVFAHIEQKKKELEEKQIDKTPVDVAKSANIDLTADYTSTESEKAAGVETIAVAKTPAVENPETTPEETTKRKRRTKAEIEAAKIAELSGVGIFSAVATCEPVQEIIEPEQKTEVVPPETLPDSVQDIKPDEIIPEFIPEIPIKEYSIEFLIDYANGIKSFASGLYAVKKACLVLGFFSDMAAVDLNKLDSKQRSVIFSNLKVCKDNEAGITDALKF